jgi:type IV pilus assembly protein PilC
MATFVYTAVDARGQQKNGSIDAATKDDAAAAIKAQGLYPTRIAEGGSSAAAAVGGGEVKRTGGGGRVKSKILTVFTRQLATLIDAGLPLLRSLNTLIRQEKNKNLRGAMQTMASSVEGGSTFSEALSQHPRIFNKLFINMVRAGELGGVLEVVLTRLAEFQEKSDKIKGKVVAAMFYPVVVLFIAMAILAFLLVFIVPKFQAIFTDMLGGKRLPLLTEMVIGVSDLVKNNIIILIGGIVVLVVGYKLFARTAVGALFIDKVKLSAPLIGNLVSKTSISRFARTLGTLVSSGVPILQALNITKETVGNLIVAGAISKVHDSVKEGESIVTPLEASGVFPPMVISMIQVGEETGKLPDMLIKIAEVYDEEVDNAVAGLTSLLEPIMIVFLAVVVGTIVIALFLPLVSIISNLGQQAGG